MVYGNIICWKLKTLMTSTSWWKSCYENSYKTSAYFTFQEGVYCGTALGQWWSMKGHVSKNIPTWGLFILWIWVGCNNLGWLVLNNFFWLENIPFAIYSRWQANPTKQPGRRGETATLAGAEPAETAGTVLGLAVHGAATVGNGPAGLGTIAAERGTGAATHPGGSFRVFSRPYGVWSRDLLRKNTQLAHTGSRECLGLMFWSFPGEMVLSHPVDVLWNLQQTSIFWARYLGLSPLAVSIRMTWNMFKIGDSNLNRHLPLLLGRKEPIPSLLPPENWCLEDDPCGNMAYFQGVPFCIWVFYFFWSNLNVLGSLCAPQPHGRWQNFEETWR